MSRIDTSEWISFSVASIFETQKKGKYLQVPTGASIKKKDLEEGDIPRITVTSLNNGIFGYYKDRPNDCNHRVYENFISISFLGTVFYQPNKTSLDMKVHCLKPLMHKLNKYTGEFLVTSIVASLKESSYANQISSTVLPNLEIILPVDDLGNPDWTYMEKYMKQIEREVKDSLSQFERANNTMRNKISIDTWLEFAIEDLFDVIKGSRLTKMEMQDGDTRYIGASSFNNGITTYIANKEKIHPAETLTTCYNGSDIGRTFYQDEEYWATDDVNVLYPKFQADRNILMFFAPLIKAVGRSHEYEDKWKIEDMKAAKIYLPVASNGEPNWDYMREYMQKIHDKVKQNLDYLRYNERKLNNNIHEIKS